MKLFPLFRFIGLIPVLSANLLGQTFPKEPLEIRQLSASVNFSSVRGVPLSNVRNNPAGSDGRAPAIGTQLPPFPSGAPTVRQFQSVMAFGGGVRIGGPANSPPTLNFANQSLVANAVSLNLPRLGGSKPTHVLLRARFGSPVVARGVDFLFGSIIPVPDTDEFGTLLSSLNLRPENYWAAEPHSINNHAGAPYYWSPNARVVFATKPGTVEIAWRKVQGAGTAPGTSASPTNSVSEAGQFYTLFTKKAVVSGSLIKPSRTIYWTQGDFTKVGKPVSVPGNQVSDIAVAYNDQVPARVAKEYEGSIPVVPNNGTNVLQETRTLWFDRSTSQILAYNAEGRVFVELLGDANPDKRSRKHLGFEIVDILQQPTAQDLVVNLGDRLWPYGVSRRAGNSSFNFADASAGGADLIPDVQPKLGDRFIEVNTPSSGQTKELYAIRETKSQNDSLVYWMEEGVQGLIWPRVFARYTMIWPMDVTDYSHYLRPTVPSAAEAKTTGVLMDAANAPLLLYQDAPEQPRAFLDPDLVFYTHLTPTFPAHRSLLRYTSGNQMLFERVLSWSDGNLVSTNWTGTVVTNLVNFLPDPIEYVRNPGFEAPVIPVLWQTGVTGTGRPDDGSWTYFISAGITKVGSPWLWYSTPVPGGLQAAYLQSNASGDGGISQTIKLPAGDYSLSLRAIGRYSYGPAGLNIRIGDRVIATWNREQISETEWKSFKTEKFNIPESGNHLLTIRTFGLGNGFDRATVVDEVKIQQEFFDQAPTVLQIPRIDVRTVDVGQRILPPSGEIGDGGGTNYLAGFIRSGRSYHPGAYKNPFAAGFEAANRGAIIPVNAIPNTNTLEVWWFRRNITLARAGLNTVAWPSVLGRYTIQYPTNPKEIVLASNAGTGGLDSLVAKGSIYYENDPVAIGYNPNEEHALMIGGQGWALRDDLNITSGGNFSSLPFVLIDHTGSDGRPSMAVFMVLREKPAAGLLFDYVVEAGQILQAPMPLPLLPPPVEGEGVGRVNYNQEILPGAGQGNLPVNWSESRDGSGPFRHYKSFSIRDRKDSFWVYRGLHLEPTLQSGRYNTTSKTFTALPQATAIINQPFKYYIHASRRSEGLIVKASATNSLPNWLVADSDAGGIFLGGTPPQGSATPRRSYAVEVIDVGLSQTNRHTDLGGFSLEVLANGNPETQPALSIRGQATDGQPVVFTGRPPFLADRSSDTNSFRMRFYYKTEEGFAWPNRTGVPVGSIVPYLRPRGAAAGSFTGGDPDAKATASLDIVYRPAWPTLPPILQPGQTLTGPMNGLPAIRGQTSAEVLYQQSIATNITLAKPSVVLIDPTQAKTASLASVELTRLPSGILTEANQGLTYFPNLPPHLASRVYYNPNVGKGGSLVLKGEFKDEPVGEKYLQLNVLRGTAAKQDLQSVLDLCPASPVDEKTKWNRLVNGLTAVVDTFQENPNVPGQFVPNPSLRTNVTVGNMVEISSSETAVDSYALSASGPGYGMVSVIVGNGRAFTPPGEPVSVHVLRVSGGLWPGELKVMPSANPLNEQLTLQHTPDLAGRFDEFEYEWRIGAPVDGAPPPMNAGMTQWKALQSGAGLPRYTLGGAGIQVLSDNYLTMRYRSVNTNDPVIGQWSRWTEPQLAEGWIKRVLAGINPFQQRVKDLYNNAVNTDVSVISQAGRRWEGAIALNLKNINNSGLVEIYETVLRRGRELSIDAGINYGPANDALLLVAGYLNDLYSLLGDEAKADAANPTIATGTGDGTEGSVATAKFSFGGQLPSLLEEELGLLRGRDDFMQPGVQTAPAYNRLYWNFTRGINSGEVIYTENYNIKDLNTDGVIDAADAAKAFPQGHGDAYGHYLTGLKGYYGLIINNKFDWVPRSEAVTILGKAIQVDYVDERKFAAAAGSVSQTGLEVLKLVFRQSYRSGDAVGWDRFGETRQNTNRAVTTVRHWGMDHWASRVGQGAYLNWVVGNSMLPEVDPDPTHEGIQKIDRTTVPELGQLPLIYREVQQVLDNAEAGLTPLGLARDSLALDINPNVVTGANPKGHFEQLYDRTVGTLENAAMAFDEARTMSTAIRSEGDSLEEVKAKIQDNERALTTKLIELYGSPYTDDIGAGKTYPQDYSGPDLVHYLYVEMPEYTFPESTGENGRTFEIPMPGVPKAWETNVTGNFYGIWEADKGANSAFYNAIQFPQLTNLTIKVTSEGYTPRPDEWSGRRAFPGRIQQAISGVVAAERRLALSLDYVMDGREDFQKAVDLFKANWQTSKEIYDKERDLLIAQQTFQSVNLANDLFEVFTEKTKATAKNLSQVVKDALPTSLVAGLAAGGDLTSAGRAAIEGAGGVVEEALDAIKVARTVVVKALEFATTTADQWSQMDYIKPREKKMELRQSLNDLALQLQDVHALLWTVNQRRRELDDAQMKLRSLVAEGERIQADRQALRFRAAASIQGYRTRDVAFRLFRNEKLDRYETLLDLASSYSLLTANAYDYETGLLNNQSGKAFVDRIIQARALGVVRNGHPQFTGSAVGDPGLSGALAEMNADWQVLKGRLGFNNPDAYGTTASLRAGNFRILPGTDGDTAWKDVMNRARRDDILQDVDVRRMCMQLDRGDGLAVPGLVIEFSTTIADGLNLFGQPLAAGDSAFHPSAFATKIFGMGVALEGYKGMDNPFPNTGAVSGSGAVSPADPNLAFMDLTAMAATPYVYLIPVGLDSMRSPPLGDQSTIRTWAVQDVTVPMPFNIGTSDFSSKRLWQSSESLTEPLFSLRKHQAFRPVPTAAVFTPNIYGGSGGLARSQFTNSRLIGRSVWNSQWKLVIPGQTLLNNPSEGLDRFIQSVKDVKLHIVSYSYSGN